MLSVKDGPSGCDIGMKDIETKDLRSVESRGEHQIMELGEEVSSTSHLGEGILLVNPKSTVKEEDLEKLR